MGKRFECENGHEYQENLREAAIKIAKEGALEPCWCGAPRRLLIDHYYPNNEVDASYEIVHVERFCENDSDDADYDPMLFVMRDLANGRYSILLQYWVKVKGGWRYGQFPPILSVGELETLLKRIPPKYKI
jgi:hypothetical protein